MRSNQHFAPETSHLATTQEEQLAAMDIVDFFRH
jgi:hypothetical protein